jgi:hypothetical protein
MLNVSIPLRASAAPNSRSALVVRLRASAIHLGISASIALILILSVTQVWYPSPLFQLASGGGVFLLMVGCDITLGPLMTLIIFNIRKPRAELVRDLAIIGIVQVAAMCYGMYAILKVRPAYIVYNVGRFNVPVADEMVAGTEKSAAEQTVSAPWFGPPLVGARLPEDKEERTRLMLSAVGGHGDLSDMPRYYVPYADLQRDAAAHARSADALAYELHIEPARMHAAVARFQDGGADVGYLPLVMRNVLAVAAVSIPDGQFLGVALLPPSSLTRN